MDRLFPSRIRDKLFLSRLLDLLLRQLEDSPLQVSLKTLSYDTQIPECIFLRLAKLYQNPDDAPNITAEDYHIIFANTLFRYPTIRMFKQQDGSIFFEM